MAEQTVGGGAGVRCDFECDGEFALDDDGMADHLYRIAQEALTNALRHAQANRISVRLRRVGDRVHLSVQDDGKGGLQRGKAEGLGLKTMDYRARMIGGVIETRSVPGAGTVVCCVCPLTR